MPLAKCLAGYRTEANLLTAVSVLIPSSSAKEALTLKYLGTENSSSAASTTCWLPDRAHRHSIAQARILHSANADLRAMVLATSMARRVLYLH